MTSTNVWANVKVVVIVVATAASVTAAVGLLATADRRWLPVAVIAAWAVAMWTVGRRSYARNTSDQHTDNEPGDPS